MKQDKAVFILGILLTVIITGASGFLFYLESSNLVTNKSVVAIKKETPKPLAPTDAPALSDFKNTEIEVLNATKTKGLAKVYADKLTSNGYLKVKTGNYTDSTDSNILYAPSDFKDELEKIDFKNYKYIKSETIKIIIGK